MKPSCFYPYRDAPVKTACSPFRARRHAFSLVEAIITIAIMGILSSLIVSAITNAAQDSRRIMARQQQAALQTAVNAWVSGQIRNSATGQIIGISSIQGTWNTSNPTNFARLQAVSSYLDTATSDDFVTNSTANGDKIQTDAMKQDGTYILLPAWTVTTTGPEVQLYYP